MDVADVLRDRMQEPPGLQRMVVASLFVHAIAVVAVLLGPNGWIGRRSTEPRQVITISLGGGGEGARTGGFTAAGGRPVQQQTPPEETPRREALRPPAAKTPDMVLPTKTPTKPAKSTTPAPIVKQAPDDARGRTPTKGAQTAPGNAVAPVGARGSGFGLATGGGPGSGSTLDVADFCCPDYIVSMIERIRAVWNQNQNGSGVARVKFTIQRNGQLTDIALEQSSGLQTLDLAAQRALFTARALEPLPGAFPNSTLTVHLTFEYRR